MILPIRQALGKISDRTEQLTERIESELSFAEQLCKLHPDKKDERSALIKHALSELEAASATGRIEEFARAVHQAEAIMAPIGSVAKTYTMHCVGHAHIDMNWMWSWPETVAVTLDTFRTVLRLMDEYPSFKFSQSQASTYAIVEQHDPALLEQIAGRVREGRWEVTASHWVEGDKNLVSGESLCRHLLYTRRYMRKLFALKPDEVPIDWAPDTFGHAATVPSYLVRGQIKYLYLHRPGIYTEGKPPAFWWEGPDGSRVLVRNDMRLGYNQQISPALIPHFLAFIKHTGGRDSMSAFGVGDHGGGPTRRDILRALELDSWPIMPRFRFASALEFFQALEKQAERLPVIRGELNTEFAGCYTSQSLIKKANRFSENRLLDTELAASVAWAAAGMPYPHSDIERAWRDTLFSHFHDILPGSCVHDTRTYTHGLYQNICATAASIETRSLRLIAERVDTSAAGLPQKLELPSLKLASSMGAGVGFRSANGAIPHSDQSLGHGPRPFVIFNPSAFDRDEIVEATLWDNAPGSKIPLQNRAFSVICPDGKEIMAQTLGGGSFWAHEFVSVAFPAVAPALGYAAYIVKETAAAAPPDQCGSARLSAPGHHCPYAAIERGTEGLENDLLRISFNMRTGAIGSLIDKRSGMELIAQEGPGAGLEYMIERARSMSAWLIEHSGPSREPELTAFRRGKQGPYIASVELDFRIEESEFTITYAVHANDPKLYITITGTWFQRGTPRTGAPGLCFRLPLALSNAAASYEIPFGAIDRPFNSGEEVPALQWAKVTGENSGMKAGCILLNDCKHGHSLDGNLLRLSLIRSSYEPDNLPEIGRHEMRLALLPLQGELSVSQAMREGQAFNRRLRLVGASAHSGQLDPVGRFFWLKAERVMLSSIKKAEEEDAFSLRLFNPTGESEEAELTLNTALFGEAHSVQELDMMEQSLKTSHARLSGDKILVPVPAHGIVSLLIKTNAARND